MNLVWEGGSSGHRQLRNKGGGAESCGAGDFCAINPFGSLMKLRDLFSKNVLTPKIKDVRLQKVNTSLHRPLGIQNPCKDTTSFKIWYFNKASILRSYLLPLESSISCLYRNPEIPPECRMSPDIWLQADFR